MSIVEGAVVGVLLLMAVIAGFAVRTLIQMHRTAKAAEKTWVLIREEAGPLIEKARETVGQIEDLAQAARWGGNRISSVLRDAGERLGRIRRTMADTRQVWSDRSYPLWSAFKAIKSTLKRFQKKNDARTVTSGAIFVQGAFLGGFLALFFTPCSGRQLRQRLKRQNLHYRQPMPQGHPRPERLKTNSHTQNM
ncbi:MAG: YtxH domain-containing protein [Candidatus Omnitrophica bacterium]|nr:YtxH domain-containing protein [Candidatus Omnitrophota bacterium]